MSADIRPHVYKPLPTPKAHCAKCLGTVRSDFCKVAAREDARNLFAEVMALHNPNKVPHGKSADYYVGWHRAIEAALRLIP